MYFDGNCNKIGNKDQHGNMKKALIGKYVYLVGINSLNWYLSARNYVESSVTNGG